ncbi:hypothetical protein AAEP93_003642 [Penicillium crustosum]
MEVLEDEKQSRRKTEKDIVRLCQGKKFKYQIVAVIINAASFLKYQNDEAQKDEDQTKEQTYHDDANDDAKSVGQDNNNNDDDDEGEEGRKQDSISSTVSPCTHRPLSKWTCVPYWNGS